MNQLKKLLLLLLCFASFAAKAQPGSPQISIINFTVKQKLPADVSTWNSVPASVLLVAKYMGQGNVVGAKLILQIKKGGSRICGNDLQSATFLDAFQTRNFNANELTGAFTNCTKLSPGSYSLCAQFYGEDRKEKSLEVCRPFIVEDVVQIQELYSPPQNITPGNGKIFKPEELKGPVTFRWTPVVPKPKDVVTYRLKVWQLMQEQTGIQAMRSSTPVVEKDVNNITQAVVTNIYTGPCKPPYLCDYVWLVQAVNKDGKPIGNNEGRSELWSFKVQNEIDIQIDSLKVDCCINGKQNIYLKVKNNLATAVNIVAVKYKVNGVGASINLSPIAPPLTQMISGNGSLVFTSSINCIDALNFLKFLVDAEQVADPDNTETEVKSDTLKCRCDACDEKNFSLTAPSPAQINFANNILSFAQPLTIITTPAKPIKSIKAELVYFEMIPENDYCIPCNKDAATYGHFTNGTNSTEWSTINLPQNFNITTPQMTPCCSAVFKWCIRYKIEFKDCTTCNKTVCYEKKKEGCIKDGNTK